MRLGYMAIGNHGDTIHLGDTKHPRKTLLEKLGATNADKIFVDDKDGKPKHIGYVVQGQWFQIYEVHEWKKGD